MDQVPHHQISEVRLAGSGDDPGPEVLDLREQLDVVLQAEPRYLHIHNLGLQQERIKQRPQQQQDQTFRVAMSSLMWWVVKFASSW